MEQERKIEKWLRSYAKKRRGQAGESFKLDPATRRILHSEVSHSAPPSEENDETMSVWQVLRRQWIYLLGFAACVFVIATFFLHSVNTAKQRLEIAGTSQPKLDMLSSAGSSPRQLSQAKKAQTDTYASETNLAMVTKSRAPELASAEPAMTPPASAMQPAAAGGNFGGARNQNQALPQIAESGELQQSFAASRQVENTAENSFKNTSAQAAQSTQVLMNFQVSQIGNVIRVVDQDGSVYSGVLQPGGQPAAKTDNELVQADKVEQKNDNSTVDIPTMGALPASNPSGHAQGYAFRVQGMNKTLKQSVLFTGTLLEDLSMAKDVQQSFGLTANAAVGAAYAQQLMKSEQTNPSAQLPWSKLRITGTAIINNTNRIAVNATPVPHVEKATGPK